MSNGVLYERPTFGTDVSFVEALAASAFLLSSILSTVVFLMKLQFASMKLTLRAVARRKTSLLRILPLRPVSIVVTWDLSRVRSKFQVRSEFFCRVVWCTWHYTCNCDSAEKFTSNSGFKSEYLTWNKFEYEPQRLFFIWETWSFQTTCRKFFVFVSFSFEDLCSRP